MLEKDDFLMTVSTSSSVRSFPMNEAIRTMADLMSFFMSSYFTNTHDCYPCAPTSTEHGLNSCHNTEMYLPGHKIIWHVTLDSSRSLNGRKIYREQLCY